MTDLQKVIKYIAIGLAALLAVSIVGGIVSAVGVFGSILFPEDAVGDTKTYTVSGDIHSLCVDISAADIAVKQGEAFLVESNLKHLTVSEQEGVLFIKDTKKLFQSYNGGVLTVTVPTGFSFKKAELQAGAGRLQVEALSANHLDCDFGAGEVRIDSLTALSWAEIEGGAGEITISGGALKDLEFHMGVGRLSFTSALTGQCEFELGVGESNITLLGQKEDYTLDLEKGIGEIRVDGEVLSNTVGYGDGPAKVELHGGIGAIRVRFEAPVTQ